MLLTPQIRKDIYDIQKETNLDFWTIVEYLENHGRSKENVMKIIKEKQQFE